MLALQWDKDVALQARFDDGFNSGVESYSKSIVTNMIGLGKSLDEIQAVTKLPLDRIRKFANNA